MGRICAWTTRCMAGGKLVCIAAISEVTSSGCGTVRSCDCVKMAGARSLAATCFVIPIVKAVRWSCANVMEVVNKNGVGSSAFDAAIEAFYCNVGLTALSGKAACRLAVHLQQ